MAKLAVIKAGGKQYLVKKDDEIVVDKLDVKEKDLISLDALAIIDSEKSDLKLGNPNLTVKAKAKVIQHFRGEKVNILKFKSKVRYAKRKGFRQELTKIKIVNI
jgi:large subunit ribosomal protein L21